MVVFGLWVCITNHTDACPSFIRRWPTKADGLVALQVCILPSGSAGCGKVLHRWPRYVSRSPWYFQHGIWTISGHPHPTGSSLGAQVIEGADNLTDIATGVCCVSSWTCTVSTQTSHRDQVRGVVDGDDGELILQKFMQMRSWKNLFHALEMRQSLSTLYSLT